MLRILVTLVLAAGLCYGMPAPSQENSNKDHKELSAEHCTHIAGGDEFETYRQRQACENVFRNEYIKWSETMLADANFADSLEVRDVTVHSEDNDGRMATAKGKASRQKRSSECPVFDNDYLRKYQKAKDRSISPWKYIINQDKNRVPPRIVDSVCLCEGCIDIVNRQEDARNLLSVRLPLTIPVTRDGEMTTIDVHLGCTCQVTASF